MKTETQTKHTLGMEHICRASNHENELCPLHAAAPELLSACKVVCDELQAALSSGEPRKGLWFERRIEILRAAIAKAENR